ncbi:MULTISPECIES: ribonuclease Z [Bacillus]|uniref:Ribonuclease Z n=1 Tax=Bacillus pseudomycoides TaxID=64104 RepID=A0A1Y3MQK9_9BACI|nr:MULTISPECIES: ribonuclease Z [Bacillus cereus group]EOP50699.1 ribonuclease Z [Bacillus cereus VD136]EOP66847.1 ribonuclease Z [Bacillus cereus VDM006]EOQ03374.1 ribonuclease Z [Bacillus cereus VDM021]OOG94863.1 Ribonuclease Z [Bacillus mycoides]MDF2082871.1 ribonuclease Z [Bacillus pseudomycoides]
MEFVFLGTGAGVPSKGRNVSAIALQLLEERGETWLFDCGEATQHQILHTSVRPRRIEKIFITHLHGDHIFGLPGLLGSRSFQGGTTPLTVYGPKGIKQFIEVALSVSTTHVKYPLKIVEITEEGIVFEDKQFHVETKRLSHGVECFGYRIVEKDIQGHLLVEKLLEAGVKPGPIFKRLKDGEVVELEDGRVLHGKDFIGPPQKGRIITILGDTRYCEASRILAQDADILVHEATFAAADEIQAHDYFHSTTEQAASIALQANVKRLILTHISSRYQADTYKELLQEAQLLFANTEIAMDLKCFPVER